MQKRLDACVDILCFIAITAVANVYLLLRERWWLLWVLVPIFLLANTVEGIERHSLLSRRMRICRHGTHSLIVFFSSASISLIYHTVLGFLLVPEDFRTWLWSFLFCVTLQYLTFLNGMLSVYLTSYQLGITRRIVSFWLGWIPILQLFVLGSIIRITYREIAFETERAEKNAARAYLRLCETKYPILMVHGLFFRDFKHFDYWGRIPADLRKNGATLFYGHHQSAASVADSAGEIAARIRRITEETGCEKVNIIAHSKGGIDSRYAIRYLGVADKVASLTTVNTPHRGCLFAENLLETLPEKVKNGIVKTYNTAYRVLGDTNPDFLAAVKDLTATACKEFDDALTVPPEIYCQSVGSEIKTAMRGRFPMNLSFLYVKNYDGPNDGLVATTSFAFGERYIFLETNGKRGISHGDVIDLSRENIEGFDVREFYVELVHDLARRGY